MTLLARRARFYGNLFRQIGWLPAMGYITQRVRLQAFKRTAAYTLWSQKAQHPLRCRHHTSDIDVFVQIFVNQEYAGLKSLQPPGLILDCGANVGYAAAYLLTRFAHAHLIAIEPDPGNFALLAANLAPYGERARVLRQAVWSHPADLVLQSDPRPRQEWATRVRPAQDGDTHVVPATDVGTLLAESGFERIALLKMDIEGAEQAVFSSNYEAWLTKVDQIAIELHGEACRSTFFRAIEPYHYSISQSSEYILCKAQNP